MGAGSSDGGGMGRAANMVSMATGVVPGVSSKARAARGAVGVGQKVPSSLTRVMTAMLFART